MKINVISLKSSLFILTLYFNTCLLHTMQSTAIKIYEGVDNPKETLVTVSSLKERPVSLHFLLPTIGRKSIFKMLKSLQNQVQPQDYITVIFDGKDRDQVLNKVKIKLAQFSCKTNIIFEKQNLGYWGHSIRNKYNTLPGDFVLHCDDDNTYADNSLSVIRKICNDPTRLYIFRIKFNSRTYWITPCVKQHCIDTANGVIPTKYNTLSSWELRYGGDYDFYSTLIKSIPTDKITFVDFVIYRIKKKIK